MNSVMSSALTGSDTEQLLLCCQHHCNSCDRRLILPSITPHPERRRRFRSTRPVWTIATPGSCANPLHFIQNCKKVQLLFNLLEFFHTAELLHTLRWLLKSDSTVPACHPVNSSDPSETQDVAKPVHPSESSTANQLATPSLRGWPSYRSTQSRPLAVLTPQWWNELPIVLVFGFFFRMAKNPHIPRGRPETSVQSGLLLLLNVALQHVWFSWCTLYRKGGVK